MRTISITFAISTLFLCILFFTMQAYADHLPSSTAFQASLSGAPEIQAIDHSMIHAELEISFE